MYDIRHRVVVDAPEAQIYRAIAEPQGISGWWTRDGVTGEAAVGSELGFHFGGPDPAAVMEVTSLRPGDEVGWRCVGGADEWIGTELTFALSPAEGGTAVLFTHAGWRAPSDFMAHCSARWAYFLLSLKQLVETGKGTPFPDDLKF